MNDDDSLKQMLFGLDLNTEVLNLWYEIIFLRHSINMILSQNVSVYLNIDPNSFDACRKIAEEEVRKKFPFCNFIDKSEKSEMSFIPETKLVKNE